MAVVRETGLLELGRNLLLGNTVQNRSSRAVAERVGGQSQVILQELAQIHTRNNAERRKNDVNRRSILQERHVADRDHAGNNAFIPVASGHLVAHLHLPQIGHRNLHLFYYSGLEFVALFGRKNFHVDHLAVLAVFQIQRRVAHISGLLAENSAQQPFFRREFGLAFGRDLADQDIAGMNFGANTDNAFRIQILELFLADIRDVACYHFGPKLGFAHVGRIMLNLDGSVAIVAHQPLRDNDGVLVVKAVPHHVSHEHVLAQSQLAVLDRRTIAQRLALFYLLAKRHDGRLVNATRGVRADKFMKAVSVHFAFLAGKLDTGAVDGRNLAVVRSRKDVPRRHGRGPLHAGTDERRVSFDARHALALHVRAHEGARSVVMFQKGNQARRHAQNLVRSHVQVIYDRHIGDGRLAMNAGRHFFFLKIAFLVNLHGSTGCAYALFLERIEVDNLVSNAGFYRNFRPVF